MREERSLSRRQYPPTHSWWAKWAGLSARWRQSRRPCEARSVFPACSLPVQGTATVVTGYQAALTRNPQAYLRLARWRENLRVAWPRTGPRERSLESTGWRSQSPPRRSCGRRTESRGWTRDQRTTDVVKAQETERKRVRTDENKKVEEKWRKCKRVDFTLSSWREHYPKFILYQSPHRKALCSRLTVSSQMNHYINGFSVSHCAQWAKIQNKSIKSQADG